MTYAPADKNYMLVMLRHLNSKHRYFDKGYVSRQKEQRLNESDYESKKDIMRSYATDLEGMPTLKGSNPKAKSTVYNQLLKPKKPTRKEKDEKKRTFQEMLAQDERNADEIQQIAD